MIPSKKLVLACSIVHVEEHTLANVKSNAQAWCMQPDCKGDVEHVCDDVVKA